MQQAISGDTTGNEVKVFFRNWFDDRHDLVVSDPDWATNGSGFDSRKGGDCIMREQVFAP
jgi:hypothetical protein